MAGIKNPTEELDLAEVHDCFTITELLNIQDLQLCASEARPQSSCGTATRTSTARCAVNPSGGLKCFGHPVGATGCRMLCEVTKQIQGRAEGAQVKNARLGPGAQPRRAGFGLRRDHPGAARVDKSRGAFET